MRLGVGALALAGVWLSGCPDEPAAGRLEIGVRDGATGAFRPLADGDRLQVVLGGMTLPMLQPSLRATGIDPRAPDPLISVTIGDVVIGADYADEPADMQPDGAAYILWDLRVPFQTLPCCWVCRQVTMKARLEDSSRKVFEGSVTVELARDTCPDPAVCCASAADCPDPAMAQVCE